MISLAKEFGQPWDVTPEKLLALYKKQRGRCEETGVALTYTPGRRETTSINLDHVEDLLRGASRLNRSMGGTAIGGQAAMMSNLRFVCQHAHYLKARIHDAGGSLDDLLPRLAVRFLNGPPCNPSIDICNLEAIAFGTSHARSILEEWSKNWTKRPSASNLMANLKQAGIEPDKQCVYRFLQDKFGCDTRSDQQRRRVEVAAGFLMNSPHILGLIRQGSRVYFAEAKQDLLREMLSAGCSEVTDCAMREDIAVAFELLTGKKAPLLDSRNSTTSGFVRSKLDTWSKPTPVMRKTILGIIEESGDDGVPLRAVVDRIMEVQVIGGVDEHGIFRNRIASSVEEICLDLVSRRLIDQSGDVLVGRLDLSRAAKRCGYTPLYLQKCHKIGIGPDCEYSRPGKGRSLTFSRREIDEWMNSRRATTCVQKSLDLAKQQSFLCLVDQHGGATNGK